MESKHYEWLFDEGQLADYLRAATKITSKKIIAYAIHENARMNAKRFHVYGVKLDRVWIYRMCDSTSMTCFRKGHQQHALRNGRG